MSPRSAEGFAAPSYSTSARRPHCEGQPKTYWKPSRLELLSCRDSYCNSQAHRDSGRRERTARHRMSSFTVTGLISKLEHRDRDFRYMASSDLLAELQKESFKPDSDGEKKLCRSILKLLHDQSSDVQGLAVKCLSPLVRKVHGQLVEEIMVELVKDVLTGKEDQRDICSIGLKTVVLEMPQTMALSAVRHLAPKLVEGLSSQTLEVKLECMDILNDTLKRFGSQLKEDESDRCLGALFVELGSPRPASRKARRARNLPLLRAPLDLTPLPPLPHPCRGRSPASRR